MYWSLPSTRSRLSRSSRYFSRSASGSNARSGIRGPYFSEAKALRRGRVPGGVVDLAGPVAHDVDCVGLHQVGLDPVVLVAVELVQVAPRIHEIEGPAQ